MGVINGVTCINTVDTVVATNEVEGITAALVTVVGLSVPGAAADVAGTVGSGVVETEFAVDAGGVGVNLTVSLRKLKGFN